MRRRLGFLLFALLPIRAVAQVVLDGTVGSAGPGPVAAGLDDQGQPATYLIHDGLGERAEQNLFHSFSRFDVGPGETATFTSTSPVPPDNVLARVTGGSESQIYGRLRSTIPGADLWLINPAGWLFGAGSSLDVPGSLHITSGEYVRHEDGTRFGVGLEAAPALSIAPVEAFGFLDAEVGELRVEQTQLELREGETFSLIGGDIGIRGFLPEDRRVVWVPSGRINLAAVASSGEVVLDDSHADPKLDVDAFAALGRIEVTDRARIAYAGDPGGTAVIRADSFLLDQSFLDGTTSGDKDHPGVSADLGVRGAITISGQRVDMLWPTLPQWLHFPHFPAQVISSTTGPGRGGSIRVRGDTLRIAHAGVGESPACRRICSGLFSQSWGGVPGDIDVGVRELDISEYHAGISGSRFPPSLARGGAIRLVADEIKLDRSVVAANSNVSETRYAEADAGDISIRAKRLELTREAGFAADTNGSGQGGKIHIIADEIDWDTSMLPYRTPAGIVARTLATGPGGQILIEGGDMTMDGVGAITTTSKDPVWFDVLTREVNPTPGDAGSITLHLDNLSMRNGAAIASSTFSGGAGGRIEIRVRNLFEIEGEGNLVGPNGPLSNINTISVRAEDTQQLSQVMRDYPPDGPRPAGDAGDIEIEAQEMRIEGGWIASSTLSEGAAGDVTIRANRLLVSVPDSRRDNPFAIESETFRRHETSFRDPYEPIPFPQGPAGSVNLIGTGSDSELRVEDGAIVSARTENTGDGGDLFVDFDRVMIQDGGLLTVASALVDPNRFPVGSAGEEEVSGRAGNLTLLADTLHMSNGGRILAQSTRSDGGNIDIRAASAVELFGSSISAEVRGGPETQGGNISIDPIWVILDDGSLISTGATQGQGGDISIRTQGLFVSPDSAISAASQYGVSGTVAVDSPESNLSGELASLSQDYLDAAALIGDRCGAGNASASSFAVREELAIAPAPDEALASPLLEQIENELAQAR